MSFINFDQSVIIINEIMRISDFNVTLHLFLNSTWNELRSLSIHK